MKVLRSSELTDDQWKSFGELKQFVSDNYSTIQTGEDLHWQKLKEKILGDVNDKSLSFNEYYFIYNGNDVTAYIDAFDSRGKLYFDFNTKEAKLSGESMNLIGKMLEHIFKTTGYDSVLFYSYDKRKNKPILDAGIDIEDEMISSRLDKADIDFNQLKRWAEENKHAENYTVKLLHGFPEEMHDTYVELVNEIRDYKLAGNDKNDEPVPLFRKEDLRMRIKEYIAEKAIIYFYGLFDGDKLCGMCFVFLDKLDGEDIIEHRGGLTAIGKNYRGKGFAKFLKAKTYLKINEDFPDFKYAITDTDASNTHMYRINEEFGFKVFDKGYCFRLTKDNINKFS